MTTVSQDIQSLMYVVYTNTSFVCIVIKVNPYIILIMMQFVVQQIMVSFIHVTTEIKSISNIQTLCPDEMLRLLAIHHHLPATL